MRPEKGLRKRKKAEVKKTLYLAAMELFRKHGFDETTVEEIVERAGFSRATFFNHFGTKHGVLRFYGQELQNLIEQIISQADETVKPLDLVRQVIFAMAQEAASHPEEVKIIFAYSLSDPEYLTGTTPARKRVHDIITDLVAQAQKQRQVRQDIAARELALHILSLYQGVLLAGISGLGSPEALLPAAWQFISGGLKNGNSQAR